MVPGLVSQRVTFRMSMTMLWRFLHANTLKTARLDIVSHVRENGLVLGNCLLLFAQTAEHVLLYCCAPARGNRFVPVAEVINDSWVGVISA